MSNVVPLRRARANSTPARLTYTVQELSDLLGLGLGLTYAALQNGEIPARKVGSRWVISKAAIHAWLDATTYEDKEVS
jgi:excisionase family DNA binding protein